MLCPKNSMKSFRANRFAAILRRGSRCSRCTPSWCGSTRVYDLGLLSRILATPEFKVNDGYRTELNANSFSGRCWWISTCNISNIRAPFPAESPLATPAVRIPPAPPSSPPVFGHLGESIEIRSYARDLRSWTDPENVSGGTSGQKIGQTYPGTILLGPSARQSGVERI